MNIKTILSTLFFTLSGTIVSQADTYLQGAQVTSENNLVSGKPYILYYVSNSTGCYVKTETNDFKVVDNYMTIDDNVIYYFISDTSGKWKIKNKATNKYFPVPIKSETEFTPEDNSENAGLWTLNFLENGNIAPYAHNTSDNVDYSLNRSSSILHGWNLGIADVNQFKIYELNIAVDHTKLYKLNNNDENKWMFAPTDDGNHYYLFNTDQSKFAYPSESGDWTLSDIAVPVSVVKYDDTKYQIKTKDGKKTFSLNNNEELIISQLGDVSEPETTKLNTAKGKLLGQNQITSTANITAITTPEVNKHADGWYALRIHSDSEQPLYDGDFLYTLAEENQAFGRPHPMSHGGEYMKHPLKDDATYYVRLWPVTLQGFRQSLHGTSQYSYCTLRNF